MNDDMISRQAVLRIIQSLYPGMPRVPWLRKDWQERYEPYINTEKAIKTLPSVQPEIIRCKDCKHHDPEDKKCDSGHSIQWQLPRDDNWFCADAERRTDEQETNRKTNYSKAVDIYL